MEMEDYIGLCKMMASWKICRKEAWIMFNFIVWTIFWSKLEIQFLLDIVLNEMLNVETKWWLKDSLKNLWVLLAKLMENIRLWNIQKSLVILQNDVTKTLL